MGSKLLTRKYSKDSTSIPVEIWEKIISYLDVAGLRQILLTSKFFHSLASNPKLWMHAKISQAMISKYGIAALLLEHKRFKRIQQISIREIDFNRNNRDVHLYNINTSSYYREERPYKILSTSASFLNIRLELKPKDLFFIESMTLKLHHCSTSSEGVIDIFFNRDKLFSRYLAPKWDFGWETFTINSPIVERNMITIALADESPGVYWLSDAKLNITVSDSDIPDI